MQFTIAAAALVATTAASSLSHRDVVYNLNSTCDTTQPIAKVVNRCSYPVYIWSIDKQYGCPKDSGLELKTGDFYHENFQLGTDGGISIKISKFETCGGKDISQLEYKIQKDGAFAGNYLDMSFVDCVGNLEDCPGRTDGFYLKSGNEGGIHTSAVNNEHCPVFSVKNAEEAAKVSYINWDDRQTKYCNTDANLQLFLCGGEAPDEEIDTPYAEPEESSAAPSSTQVKSSSSKHISKPKPTSTKEAAPSATEEAEEYVVAAAAAVTDAPEVPEQPAGLVVKTETVYVTQYVDKRHAHARRHQHFRA